MEKQACERHKRGALFIPAGLFLGLGSGFVWNNIPAGLMIGLGLGFLGYAIVAAVKK